LVPAAGYQLDLADLRGLQRQLSLKFFLFLWSLVKGSFDCLLILHRRRPDVVVGGGGYVSAVPVLLGWLFRKPTLIVELDSHMGLANRLLALLAKRVCLSFAIPGRKGRKYMLTGRPLPRCLLEATPEAGRRLFNLKEGVPVVLVSGGSLGARSINLACVEAFGHSRIDFQVVHVSGRRDYGMIKEMLQEQGADLENYHLLDYTNDLPLAMAAADLVVGRAGASVLEVAALGKPALLVPYPYATADHQLKNAEWMAAAGAAEIILDSELSGETLRNKVGLLLADRSRLKKMALASATLGRRDGAKLIAGEILKLALEHSWRLEE
jgi:UDP-N-acetylglucosamine--N-acetylmuramyl-(pentapeptide) pyrophosphoryl-undecaprenol N-acetylglucosamine transferase